MRITKVVHHTWKPALTYYLATSRNTYHRGTGLTPAAAKANLQRKRRKGHRWLRHLER